MSAGVIGSIYNGARREGDDLEGKKKKKEKLEK